ncbi:MAG: hypothetical protein H8D96_15785 [Desulfobacterales bacterium]|uniref:RNA polymerase sigma factor 54 DNA-binding domain-containing protein n=1 Tax=Candidatus Desulfatibia vada TaxID=2841696 RepID=A0A8J6TV82_9BACT|nr:hypothetical protein [Candidatus Desulfatibia vada]MBL6971641.1 hypothetical protein [Desulfobacterales bacterium]MBL7216474.1 hypothetical protein [Desulfobacteraceae bacterium]
MEIVHQLPGRVRIRIPEIESTNYCQRVVEGSANDARIKDLRINPACISLTVCYDPIRMEIKDVLDFLGEARPIKRPVAKKKSRLANKKTKVPETKSAVSPTAKYFKPAVSASVQEKIKHIIKSEDPGKPYSDGKISALLMEENIEIARRTVAKYREIMGILPSSKRKK